MKSLTVAVVAVSAGVALASVPTNPLPASVSNNLGAYTPYYPSGQYSFPPFGCLITQVNLLQRHGARFPTASAGGKLNASVAKLKTATSFSPQLAFVPSYQYTLGADQLIPLGAEQSYEAGQQARERYPLLTLLGLVQPFVRSDSQQRVVDSATNWTAGFRGTKEVVSPSVVINNAFGSNDTLDNNNCPNAPSPSVPETTWLNTFAPPITSRLNSYAPGAKLSNSDTLNFMQLCAFDSEYKGVVSPWCGLFNSTEFQDFEYYYDIDKQYGNGNANPLGAIQGVGYVNELLTRLTGDSKYVNNDQTQINHTLDSSDATFPLHRPFYADFSHDNQITSILAAIGLKAYPPLSPTGSPSPTQGWITSQIVPFSGRLVTERVQCGFEPFVRFFINDALQQPTFCKGATRGGLCPLQAFIDSQSYSTNNGNGDYAKCGYVPLGH